MEFFILMITPDKKNWLAASETRAETSTSGAKTEWYFDGAFPTLPSQIFENNKNFEMAYFCKLCA